jgi:hypothetical protein
MRFPRILTAIFLVFVALTSSKAAPNPSDEWILLVGGPSMHQWEQYKAQPHDHWWANFVHAARLRTEQLRATQGATAKITWLVYKQGYVDRSKQEKQDLLTYIQSIHEKFGVNIVYIGNGVDVINYLNRGQDRGRVKVAGFEYFGHSNRACFMFDYSSNLDSASKSWLHENDFVQIDRRIFSRAPYVKSWGCHTGEEMSQKWFNATGTHMIGAIGKTQFMMEELPILSSQGGQWVQF